MPGSAALIYSQGFQGYNLGPLHPMNPVRLLLTVELMRAMGLLDHPGVRVIEPQAAGEADLEAVHDRRYVETVRRLSASGTAPGAAAPEFGLGSGDNPVFEGMHTASALIAGGSLTGAKAVFEGEVAHAFNIAGGLHHAHKARAAGFCVYNDAAVAIAWLRRQGARVLYLDFDAHHGDGVQELFYAAPGVMTVSFHESGRYLFPGSGFIDELGTGAARGTSVNLPLPMGVTGDLFLAAYEALVPPLARAFKPDLLVTQLGCDGHFSDPLTHMALTVSTYLELARRLHGLAHEVAAGRWLALGGGGYQVYTVVPRAWTAVLAVMAEADIGEELPEEWRQLCLQRGAERAPEFLVREGQEPPTEPAGLVREVEELVAEVRESVFPLAGVPS